MLVIASCTTLLLITPQPLRKDSNSLQYCTPPRSPFNARHHRTIVVEEERKNAAQE